MEDPNPSASQVADRSTPNSCSNRKTLGCATAGAERWRGERLESRKIEVCSPRQSLVLLCDEASCGPLCAESAPQTILSGVCRPRVLMDRQCLPQNDVD